MIDETPIVLSCIYCGKEHSFAEESPEANDILNVYCPGGECEDRYTKRQYPRESPDYQQSDYDRPY